MRPARSKRILGWLLLSSSASLLWGLEAGAQSAARWAGSYEGPAGLRLTLEPGPNSAWSGELVIGIAQAEARFRVALRANGSNRLDGEFGDGSEAFPLSVETREDPNRIVLTSEGSVFELEREGSRSAGAGTPRPNPLAQAGAPRDSSSAAAASGRNVVFNGKRLDDATLLELEGSAPVIPDGEYWYDKRSGMAGYAGGPTLAYLAAELDFCPPLSPQASGGGTNVAVNGRYLHPQDLIGLQYYFGPIQPGRYWLDGQGDYGIENGPALGNLIQQITIMQALAASAGQGGGNGGFGGEGGSVYRNFPNLGASGTGVSVANLGGGDSIVNAGGVMWWPGK